MTKQALIDEMNNLIMDSSAPIRSYDFDEAVEACIDIIDKHMEDIDTMHIAEQLANDIFSCGDEPGSKCNRIQFMGGSWEEKNERPQGGFDKGALQNFFNEKLQKIKHKEQP